MQALCFLNGEILPVEKARISPFDRGLLYGDGIYDVVRVRAGRALHLADHLARLRDGLQRVEIPAPAVDLEAACRRLLESCELSAGSLVVQVTRGVAPRLHIPPPDLVPTLLILPLEHPHPGYGARPMRAVTLADPRWSRCDLKTTSLMGTVLGKLEARRRAVDEVLFVSPQGALREGGSTSLFVRTAAGLATHPLDGHVLPSLTRGRVLAQARRLALAVEERAATLADLASFDEAFLCGTLTGVQPLVEIDGRPIAGGRPGDWTLRIAQVCAAEEEALLEQRVSA